MYIFFLLSFFKEKLRAKKLNWQVLVCIIHNRVRLEFLFECQVFNAILFFVPLVIVSSVTEGSLTLGYFHTHK